MPNKEREHIKKMRRETKSPILLQQEVLERFGTDAEDKMNYDEAHQLYNDAIVWASWHDLAVQDYLAEECAIHRISSGEETPKLYVQKVLDAINEMVNHLGRGRQLGLNDLEQRMVDTLWGWVPHNYPDNYVNCAKEVSAVIQQLLPSEDSERDEKAYIAFHTKVIEEVKRLAEKHDVVFDTTKYNLSAGYLDEWLPFEYGIFINFWGEVD